MNFNFDIVPKTGIYQIDKRRFVYNYTIVFIIPKAEYPFLRIITTIFKK